MIIWRLVIDTNVLISAIINPHGKPAAVVDLWRGGSVEVCLSAETFVELGEVLARPKCRKWASDPAHVDALVERLRLRALFVTIPTCTQPLLPADPNDDKFLSTAVAAGADAIVTGDEHLLAIGHFHGIPILSPAAILDEIARRPA